jgi:hypothetical protein
MEELMRDWEAEAGSPPFLAGDFYREGDDVTRGLTLCNGDEFLEYTGQDVKDDCMSRLLEEEPGYWKGTWNDDADLMPKDNFFRVGETTILVQSVCAEDLQNRLLGLLADDASGVLLKVNRSKFTIKAQISIDGFSCVAKVYIYKKEEGWPSSGQYVVDIQRRSGDSLVFRRLYRWVSQKFALGGQANSIDMKPIFQEVPRDTNEKCLLQSFPDSGPMVSPLGQVCY